MRAFYADHDLRERLAEVSVYDGLTENSIFDAHARREIESGIAAICHTAYVCCNVVDSTSQGGAGILGVYVDHIHAIGRDDVRSLRVVEGDDK